MTPQEFFKKVQNSLPQLADQIARDIVAVEAENFHGMNFQQEGFTDATLQKWQPRKAAKGKKADKDKGRALLVQDSTLKGHALKGRSHGNQVDFVFPLEYMKVHNEGLQAGRGKGFTMPKRQYVGESLLLEKMIEKKARKYMDNHFKNL